MVEIDELNESEKFIEYFIKNIKSVSKDTLEGFINLYFYKGFVMRKHPELKDYLKNIYSIAAFSKAIDIAEKYDIKNDDYYWSLSFRAQCYKNINQYENAIRDYSICINKGDNKYYMDRALCYEHLNQMTKAIKDYKHIDNTNVEAILNDGPKDGLYHANLLYYADIYEMIGNHTMADKYYNKAIEMGSTKSSIYASKASCFEKIGNYKEAEKNFQKAIDMELTCWVWYEDKAKFYEKIGKFKKAEKYCKLAAEIYYNRYGEENIYKYKKIGNIKMTEKNTILEKYNYEKYISNNLKIGIEDKINDLSELKENLCVNCVDLLTITNLTEDSIPIYLKEYEQKSMIYVIRANGVPKRYKEQLTDIKNEFAMARINDSNFEYYDNLEDVSLYVGSSHNIYKRLLEHLGFGAKKTFALHLKEWWDEKEPIQIEIYEVFNNKNDNLQIIEDVLWSQNKPLFGRQGKK